MPTKVVGLIISVLLLLSVAYHALHLAGLRPGDLSGWSALTGSLMISVLLLLRLMQVDKEIARLKSRLPPDNTTTKR